jgi:uncharacterized protein YhaN
MHILSLELERYGPFTDRTLHFNPNARLHIVYGRNATGKSCALAGITDLFFGIEAQTRYSFLHEGKTMRLGAILQAHDLSTLEFKRRKGNKNVLFSPTGASLDDNTLQPFLGGLTRSVFSHAFGLNSAQLREGAEEMLNSEGEVGASLYAAASGLAGITRLRRQLDEEAAKIFKPGRGSDKRRFDQAAEAYSQARTEMRKCTLRSDTLEAMRSERDSLISHLASLTQTRNNDRAEHARLTRLRTMAPQFRSLDFERNELAGFADLPELSTQAVNRFRQVIAASEDSNLKHAAAVETLESATNHLGSIVVESTLLQHHPSVQTLQTNIGKYQSATRDRARVASDAESKSREILQLAARVGVEEDHLDSLQPTDAALAELEVLIEQGTKLARDREALEQSIVDGKSKLEDLEGQQDPSALHDPVAWQAKYDALKSGHALLDRRRALTRDTTATRQKLRERASRLTPSVSELKILADLSLPSSESIGRFGKRFTDLDDKRRQFGQEATALDAAITEKRQKLEDLVSSEPVASAERIAEARRKREGSWQRLRPVVLGDDSGLPIDVRTNVVELYEVRIVEADRLADAATHDADRVAQYSTGLKTLEDKRRRLLEVDEQQAQVAADLQQVKTEWLTLWSPITQSPPSPNEMTAWISAVKQLLDQRDILVNDEAELAALEPQINDLRSALADLALELALENADHLPTESLFPLLDARLKELASAWNANAINQGLIVDARKQLGRQEKSLVAHAAKESVWFDSWNVAIAALGIDARKNTAAVNAAVKVWRNLPGRRAALEEDLKRVRGMDRDIHEFEQEVTRLTELISPELPPLPPVDQARRLSTILEHHAGQQLLYNNAKAQVEKETSTFDQAKRNADRDANLVSARMSELGLSGDPTATLERLDRVAAVRTRIDAARTTLLAQSDGLSEDQLRTDLAGFDSESALNITQQLAQGFSAQDDEINQVFADKSAAEKALADAELESGAEVALQQMKGAEVELDTAAREFLTLKLSATMLNRVIDQHRSAQSVPLMQLAGSLFCDLTEGAFTRIDQELDPDHDDRPQLVGVRNTTKTVSIDGMSEGQRDQLYLALRLAYLDEYARKSEPIPFIGDDIFTTFDEHSTRAGLLALANIGAHLQPILFTHHRFVADLALEALGEKVNIISL